MVEDLREKRTENADWSLDDTLQLHKTLTEIRRQIGVRYAADETAESDLTSAVDPRA